MANKRSFSNKNTTAFECLDLTEGIDRPLDPATHDEDIVLRRTRFRTCLDSVVVAFNRMGAPHAFDLLQAHGLAESTNPTSVAAFLFFVPGLDKQQVGRYLGGHAAFRREVLKKFLHFMCFTNVDLVAAIRLLFSKFRPSGEAQELFRIINEFSIAYTLDNADQSYAPDNIAILTYGILMLHTDSHNARVRRKMSREEFVKLISGATESHTDIKTNNQDIKQEIQAPGRPSVELKNGPTSGADPKHSDANTASSTTAGNHRQSFSVPSKDDLFTRQFLEKVYDDVTSTEFRILESDIDLVYQRLSKHLSFGRPLVFSALESGLADTESSHTHPSTYSPRPSRVASSEREALCEALKDAPGQTTVKTMGTYYNFSKPCERFGTVADRCAGLCNSFSPLSFETPGVDKFLKKGMTFLKHCRNGSLKIRMVRLSEDGERLFWRPVKNVGGTEISVVDELPRNKQSNNRCLWVRDIINVTMGTVAALTLKKIRALERFCGSTSICSIHTESRTLDLCAPMDFTPPIEVWASALLIKVQRKRQKQKSSIGTGGLPCGNYSAPFSGSVPSIVPQLPPSGIAVDVNEVDKSEMFSEKHTVLRDDSCLTNEERSSTPNGGLLVAMHDTSKSTLVSGIAAAPPPVPAGRSTRSRLLSRWWRDTVWPLSFSAHSTTTNTTTDSTAATSNSLSMPQVTLCNRESTMGGFAESEATCASHRDTLQRDHVDHAQDPSNPPVLSLLTPCKTKGTSPLRVTHNHADSDFTKLYGSGSDLRLRIARPHSKLSQTSGVPDKELLRRMSCPPAMCLNPSPLSSPRRASRVFPNPGFTPLASLSPKIRHFFSETTFTTNDGYFSDFSFSCKEAPRQNSSRMDRWAEHKHFHVVKERSADGIADGQDGCQLDYFEPVDKQAPQATKCFCQNRSQLYSQGLRDIPIPMNDLLDETQRPVATGVGCLSAGSSELSNVNGKLGKIGFTTFDGTPDGKPKHRRDEEQIDKQQCKLDHALETTKHLCWKFVTSEWACRWDTTSPLATPPVTSTQGLLPQICFGSAYIPHFVQQLYYSAILFDESCALQRPYGKQMSAKLERSQELAQAAATERRHHSFCTWRQSLGPTASVLQLGHHDSPHHVVSNTHGWRDNPWSTEAYTRTSSCCKPLGSLADVPPLGASSSSGSSSTPYPPTSRFTFLGINGRFSLSPESSNLFARNRHIKGTTQQGKNIPLISHSQHLEGHFPRHSHQCNNLSKNGSKSAAFSGSLKTAVSTTLPNLFAAHLDKIQRAASGEPEHFRQVMSGAVRLCCEEENDRCSLTGETLPYEPTEHRHHHPLLRRIIDRVSNSPAVDASIQKKTRCGPSVVDKEEEESGAATSLVDVDCPDNGPRRTNILQHGATITRHTEPVLGASQSSGSFPFWEKNWLETPAIVGSGSVAEASPKSLAASSCSLGIRASNPFAKAPVHNKGNGGCAATTTNTTSRKPSGVGWKHFSRKERTKHSFSHVSGVGDQKFLQSRSATNEKITRMLQDLCRVYPRLAQKSFELIQLWWAGLPVKGRGTLWMLLLNQDPSVSTRYGTCIARVSPPTRCPPTICKMRSMGRTYEDSIFAPTPCESSVELFDGNDCWSQAAQCLENYPALYRLAGRSWLVPATNGAPEEIKNDEDQNDEVLYTADRLVRGDSNQSLIEATGVFSSAKGYLPVKEDILAGSSVQVPTSVRSFPSDYTQFEYVQRNFLTPKDSEPQTFYDCWLCEYLKRRRLGRNSPTGSFCGRNAEVRDVSRTTGTQAATGRLCNTEKLVFCSATCQKIFVGKSLFIKRALPCSIVETLVAFQQLRPEIVLGDSLLRILLVLGAVANTPCQLFCLANAILQNSELPPLDCITMFHDSYARQRHTVRLQLFQHLFQNHLPLLYQHFKALALSPEFFLSRWFGSLFAGVLPLRCLLRLWDQCLMGGETVIFQTTLAILHYYEVKLLTASFSGCLSILRWDFLFSRSNSDLPQGHPCFSNSSSHSEDGDEELTSYFFSIPSPTAELCNVIQPKIVPFSPWADGWFLEDFDEARFWRCMEHCIVDPVVVRQWMDGIRRLIEIAQLNTFLQSNSLPEEYC